MSSDIVTWSLIGGKKFCSFKKKITENTFCKNQFNISGLCSRQACPLANSRYATVLEHRGKLFLYMKTAERVHTPKDMWERIPLHGNFLRALAQINKHLQFWPRFIRRKAKQRLTRIHQYLIRCRRLATKQKTELYGVSKKERRQDNSREQKAKNAAHIQDTIRMELLDRLRQGTYGDLYDDIVNYDTEQFNDVLDQEEEDDEFNFDWLAEDDEEELDEKNPKFIAAFSDDEEGMEEDEDDLEYEYEYENEGMKNKEKLALADGLDEDLYSDNDDSDDVEDNVPDYETIKQKQQALASKNTKAQQVGKGKIAMATKVQPKTTAAAKTPAAAKATVTKKGGAAKKAAGKGIDDL